jgi:tetratricopeptide (TPR) repeat protein
LVDVAHSQNSVTANSSPNAVTILDSTKQQDGLNGSVRRVKTETSKLELKAGRLVEGPRQLVEVTTYDVSGKRIENFSYPVASSSIGKEEYEYDANGNIAAMTMRDNGGKILSRETYTYEFDRFGNWTKMVTSLVVFEEGELKREPIEVTYRSLTYYFNDSVAKVVGPPIARTIARKSVTLPRINSLNLPLIAAERPPLNDFPPRMAVPVGAPPPEFKRPPSNPPKSSSASNEKRDSTRPASAQGEVVSATRSSSANATRDRTVESAPAKKPAGNTSLEVYNSGRALFELGDFKGAVDAFLRSIELEPNSAEVYFNLGHSYLKLDKNKDAMKAFKECTRLNPEMVEGHYGFGLASFRMRRFLEAANAFKRAIGLFPNHAKAHYGLAMAYQELGDKAGVAEEYRILQTLDKNLAKRIPKTFSDVSLPCKIPPFCN